jgi:hypothetical protein
MSATSSPKGRLTRKRRGLIDGALNGWTSIVWRIPRDARKSLRRHPPVCVGPAGASSIASGLSIAIETAMVAGTFKQIGDGEFLGDIFT